MVNLEKKIKQKLAGTTLSIERLAVKAGITKQTLHNIFNKNDIKLSQLIRISEVLNVDLSYFLETDTARRRYVGFQEEGTEFRKLRDSEVQRLETENDSLKRENQLLREMNDMLKKQETSSH